MSERRQRPRSRTFKGGTIMFGVATVDCIIRNLSENGASLEIGSAVGVPDDFILIIKPESLKRKCKVAWRSADRVGVQFLFGEG